MTDTHLHPHFGEVKLGKLAPSNDDRNLKLAKYLDPAALPTPPGTVQWGVKVQQFPMFANDRLGDCTCAAVGHMAQTWTSWHQYWMPTVDEVTSMYWATGDGSGQDDTGRVETDVLNYWRNTGFGDRKDKITAYAQVDPSNFTEVKQAVDLFGGLYIGVALPITAQGQTEWKVVPEDGSGRSQPGSWGGHAVNVTAYCKYYLVVVTWGQRLRVHWDFWKKYVDEAYAVLSPDWATGDVKAPNGFDFNALQSDLSQI